MSIPKHSLESEPIIRLHIETVEPKIPPLIDKEYGCHEINNKEKTQVEQPNQLD